MSGLIEISKDADFLIENTCKYSVFDKEANANRSLMQKLTAIALRPLMITTASGKSSHWFDWHYLENPEKYEGLAVPKSEGALDVYSSSKLLYYLKNIRMSLGGWQKTALIGPDPDNNDLKSLAKTGWLYGFRTFKEDTEIEEAKYSTLINPGYKSILILRGPRNFDAIGLNPQTLEEIPLIGMVSHIRGTGIQ